MGQSLSRFGHNGITNFSKEFDIDVNKIEKSHHLKSTNNYKYIETELDTNIVKNIIISMNSCNYITTNYVYNTKNMIKLCLNNGNEIIIAISDDGKYVGKPTRASGMGLWCFLENISESQTTFHTLCNDINRIK